MSDIFDDADTATEIWLQNNIRNRKKAPEVTGFCLSCGEPTEGAFCDNYCSEDFEKLQRAKAINGSRGE